MIRIVFTGILLLLVLGCSQTHTILKEYPKEIRMIIKRELKSNTGGVCILKSIRGSIGNNYYILVWTKDSIYTLEKECYFDKNFYLPDSSKHNFELLERYYEDSSFVPNKIEMLMGGFGMSTIITIKPSESNKKHFYSDTIWKNGG